MGSFRVHGPAERQVEGMRALRADRTRLLAACDWTQVADADLTVAQVKDWHQYRKALRDLPKTVTDAADAVWPVAPGPSDA
jgi:hypothetical protein